MEEYAEYRKLGSQIWTGDGNYHFGKSFFEGLDEDSVFY
jgi:hypothetical protein